MRASSAPQTRLLSADKSEVSEKSRDGHFIAYNNGTVLDTQTNLIWAARDNGRNISWEDAQSYCENYRAGGYTDWRMPTLDELAGLYDAKKSHPVACNTSYNINVATELIDITCFASWAYATRNNGAPFDFSFGKKYWNPLEYQDNLYRALPVRAPVARYEPIEPTPVPITKEKVEEKVIIMASEPKVEEKIVTAVSETKAEEKVIILAFEDVHFDFDKSTLKPEAQTILKRNIQLLKENPKAQIRIAGYTSASGNEAYNKKLSERRANAVREYLIKEGLITRDRLSTIGYGETDPAMHEAAPKELYSQAAKANMRVLFEIIVQ